MKALLLLMVLTIAIGCSEEEVPSLSPTESTLVGEWYLDSIIVYGSIVPDFNYSANTACRVTLTGDKHEATGYWTSLGLVGACDYSDENIWWVDPTSELFRDLFTVELTSSQLILSKPDGTETYYYSP